MAGRPYRLCQRVRLPPHTFGPPHLGPSWTDANRSLSLQARQDIRHLSGHRQSDTAPTRPLLPATSQKHSATGSLPISSPPPEAFARPRLRHLGQRQTPQGRRNPRALSPISETSSRVFPGLRPRTESRRGYLEPGEICFSQRSARAPRRSLDRTYENTPALEELPIQASLVCSSIRPTPFFEVNIALLMQLVIGL